MVWLTMCLAIKKATHGHNCMIHKTNDCQPVAHITKFNALRSLRVLVTQHQIFQLDVEVNHLLGPERTEASSDLPHQRPCRTGRRASLLRLQDVLQSTSCRTSDGTLLHPHCAAQCGTQHRPGHSNVILCVWARDNNWVRARTK